MQLEWCRLLQFLSTPSARRATSSGRDLARHLKISIHALREEGDPLSLRILAEPPQFLSTPSARRATSGALSGGMAALISIHALREEGDSKNRDKISIFL